MKNKGEARELGKCDDWQEEKKSEKTRRTGRKKEREKC